MGKKREVQRESYSDTLQYAHYPAQISDAGSAAEKILYRAICIILGSVQCGLAGQGLACAYLLLSEIGYRGTQSIYELDEVLYSVIFGVVLGVLAGISVPYDRLMILSALAIIGM